MQSAPSSSIVPNRYCYVFSQRFNKTTGQGRKEQLAGTERNIVGRHEEGLGRFTGEHDPADEGVVDQAAGVAKDAAGRAATTSETQYMTLIVSHLGKANVKCCS